MKNQEIIKKQAKARRVIRTRAKISGTESRPRLAVYKTIKHISVQAINDATGKTIAAVYDTEIKAKSMREGAKLVGVEIAKQLLAKKISEAVFDKRHNKYHGLVKELADAAREGGLKF